MSKNGTTSQRRRLIRKSVRSLMPALVGFMFASGTSSKSFAVDDGFYDVRVKSIDAFLVDRVTGKLSDNIVGAGDDVFVSAGSINNTRTKPADDVLLRIGLEAELNQAFQPPVSIMVLEHHRLGVIPAGEFITVVRWKQENDLGFGGPKNNKEVTVTMLLEDVTCSSLDVVVRVGGSSNDLDNGDSGAVILPFVCKE